MTHEYREFTYTTTDGLVLFCREYLPAVAAGTVVCLPGLTRNSRDFTAIARHLAGRYRVLTPDLRGRGRSQWDPRSANYHPKIYFQDVLQLLNERIAQPVAIIGTSLGGILAMSFAAAVPDRIAAIVLNDVGPEIAPEGLARIRGYVGSQPAPGSWAAAAAQARANHEIAYPDLDDEGWLAFARATHRENEDGIVVADYDPAIGDMLRAAPSAAPNLWPAWAGISKPVFVIRGASSDILSAGTLTRMQREKPGLVSLEVANRGHVPLLNELGVPDGIDAFLAKVFA